MPMRSDRMFLAAVTSAWLSLAASCSAFETMCTLELRSVIQVDILDSVTHAPTAAGATVLLRGPFKDSLIVSNTSTSSTAQVWSEDRVKPGTYSLQIQKPGYRAWTQTGIRVEADRCHTTTFDHVIALLRRS